MQAIRGSSNGREIRRRRKVDYPDSHGFEPEHFHKIHGEDTIWRIVPIGTVAETGRRRQRGGAQSCQQAVKAHQGEQSGKFEILVDVHECTGRNVPIHRKPVRMDQRRQEKWVGQVLSLHARRVFVIGDFSWPHPILMTNLSAQNSARASKTMYEEEDKARCRTRDKTCSRQAQLAFIGEGVAGTDSSTSFLLTQSVRLTLRLDWRLEMHSRRTRLDPRNVTCPLPNPPKRPPENVRACPNSSPPTRSSSLS